MAPDEAGNWYRGGVADRRVPFGAGAECLVFPTACEAADQGEHFSIWRLAQKPLPLAFAQPLDS